MTSAPQITRSLKPYDRDLGQAGMYAMHTPFQSAGALAVVATNAYIVRFVATRPLVVASISFVVSTAASADDACDVGIYNADLTTRLGSAGATTGKLNSTGVKNCLLTAAVALTPGVVYYAAWSSGAQGGTGVSISAGNLTSALNGQLFGASPPQLEVGGKATSHVLPTSIATPTPTSQPPILALKES